MRALLIVLAILAAGSAYAGEGWQGRPSVCANITDPARSERCHYCGCIPLTQVRSWVSIRSWIRTRSLAS